MPFSIDQGRALYRRCGPVGFVREMHSLLGLRNAQGVKVRREDGLPVLENRKIRPEDISLRSLAVAILGEDRLESKLMVSPPRFSEFEGDVLEAGNDIVPSQFSDITAYNETVAGLLEVKILEPWVRPDKLAPELMTNLPSNKRVEKFIGISTPADAAQERKPGQRHPRAELSERYVTTPYTKNRANAIDVTREAIMFDLTRQLMDHAELVSDTLALRKEYLMWDLILGITNNYSYDGTTFYTYAGTSQGGNGNWVNCLNNDLVDWTSLDKVYIAQSRLVDPETGQPIVISARQLIVMPGRISYARKVIRDTEVRQGNQGNTTNVGTALGYGANPIAGRWDEPKTSQYAYKRLTDILSDANTAGLLSLISTQNGYGWAASDIQNHADAMWFAGDFKKGIVYVENLPLTVMRAAPTSYEMADRGLVFSMFVDEMGIPAWKDPRYVVRNQDFAVTTANW